MRSSTSDLAASSIAARSSRSAYSVAKPPITCHFAALSVASGVEVACLDGTVGAAVTVLIASLIGPFSRIVWSLGRESARTAQHLAGGLARRFPRLQNGGQARRLNVPLGCWRRARAASDK